MKNCYLKPILSTKEGKRNLENIGRADREITTYRTNA